jgi:hypothetical protein
LNQHHDSKVRRASLPSPRISEIVLRTSNFDVMRAWYQTVLSADPSFEYDVPGGRSHGTTKVLNFHRLCFLRVFSEFPYTQVPALFEIPNLGKPDGKSGLHHMQLIARFRAGEDRRQLVQLPS